MRILSLVLLFSLVSISLQFAIDPDLCKGKKLNDIIETGDPCTTCHCEDNGDGLMPLCAMMMCGDCPGKWEDDGSCCGVCTVLDVCEHGRKTYKNGETVPTKDPCEVCSCHVDGSSPPEIMCAMMACYCPGRVENDGTCCGRCITDECLVDGQTYKDGEKIQPYNKCAPCVCHVDGNGEGQIVCAMFDCPYCEGEVIADGSCCGQCVQPTPFTLGGPITSTLGGPITSTAACDISLCPKLKCKTNLQYQSPDMCCPECKCKVKKDLYLPGETVADHCDGCVCKNGEVVCTPPSCPKISCADPVRGDDCCYTCPNGVTCSYGKNNVIKAGEFKNVKSKVCTCMGDPWFPVAFCADRKVPKSLFKGVENQITDYVTFD